MALKGNRISLSHGATFPQSYARIVSIEVKDGYVHTNVEWHADEAARTNNRLPIDEKQYSELEANVTGTIKPACYALLKSKEEFTDYDDV